MFYNTEIETTEHIVHQKPDITWTAREVRQILQKQTSLVHPE